LSGSPNNRLASSDGSTTSAAPVKTSSAEAAAIGPVSAFITLVSPIYSYPAGHAPDDFEAMIASAGPRQLARHVTY